jgi:hypothetical protein
LAAELVNPGTGANAPAMMTSDAEHTFVFGLADGPGSGWSRVPDRPGFRR